MKRIVFVGVAATGKDTTMLAVMATLKMKAKSIDYAPEIAHLALYNGFTLDQTTNLETQLYIFAEQIKWERIYNRSKCDYVFYNRCNIDTEVICRVNLPDKDREIMENLCSYYMATKPYDLIVTLSPLLIPVEDKVRDISNNYLGRQREMFAHVLGCYAAAGHNILYVGPQSLDSRVNMIIQAIEKLP